MEVEFQFTDQTILSLSKTIAAFPALQKEKDMPIIRFGHTVNEIVLSSLENFLKVCKDKIIVDLMGTNLRSIFQNSSHASLLNYKNIENITKKDNDYLFNI